MTMVYGEQLMERSRLSNMMVTRDLAEIWAKQLIDFVANDVYGGMVPTQIDSDIRREIKDAVELTLTNIIFRCRTTIELCARYPRLFDKIHRMNSGKSTMERTEQ